MKQEEILKRIMEGIERLSPSEPRLPNLSSKSAFVWKTIPNRLEVVDNICSLNSDLLIGIENVKHILIENTKQFSEGFSANNALLWGARGMGKSSLITAVHAKFKSKNLKLIEIRREDLGYLDSLIKLIKNEPYRFIIFCDDLSFGEDESDYKSLKTMLDGGLESRPQNILFYATSNRRHLIARDMIENESSAAIHSSESVEEKVSLSDRFGLWLGFHNCTQDEYFEMVKNYCRIADIKINEQKLLIKALEWQQTRGSRSGRVAWQFISDLAGKHDLNILNKIQ
ncbi:MAG: ATP-binding protein [Paracoccaceae bacterium]|nr:ATP-binding protein [Paracoccaceae bacterium]